MMGRSEILQWLADNGSVQALEAIKEIEYLESVRLGHFNQAIENGSRANALAAKVAELEAKDIELRHGAERAFSERDRACAEVRRLADQSDKLSGLLRDALRGLENVGLQDAYVNYDDVGETMKRISAALAAPSPQ